MILCCCKMLQKIIFFVNSSKTQNINNVFWPITDQNESENAPITAKCEAKTCASAFGTICVLFHHGCCCRDQTVQQNVFSFPENRVAKCHGYDGYIRVKILAGWGKSLAEHAILQNQALFWEDLYNKCNISEYKLA